MAMGTATPPQSGARTADQKAADLLRRRAEQAQTDAYERAGVLPGMGEGQRRLADLGMDSTIDRMETWHDTGDPGAMRSWARHNRHEADTYGDAVRNRAEIAQANQGVENAALRTSAAGFTPGGAMEPAPSQGPAGLPPPARAPLPDGVVSGMTPASSGGERYSDLWQHKPEGMTFTNADIQQGIDSERGKPLSERGYGPTVGLGMQDVRPRFDMMDIINGRVKYEDLKRDRDALKAYTMSMEPADQFDSPMQEAALAGVSDYDRLIEAAQKADAARQTEAFPHAAMAGEREADRASREKIAKINADRPRVGSNRPDDGAAKMKAAADFIKSTQDDSGTPIKGTERARAAILDEILAAGQRGPAGPVGATPGMPQLAQQHPDTEAAIQAGIAKGYTREEIMRLIGAQ